MKKPAHITKIRVPFGDIDWLGHVNNARYLTYFETARSEMIQKLFGNLKSENYLHLIIAHVEVDYLSPARWNELLLVKIRPVSIGNSSWTLEYEIEAKNENHSNRLVARGKSVQVSYDYRKRKSRPIPKKVRQVLTDLIKQTKDRIQ